MKKAVVIGGSNGIGLAISKKLIDKGFFIEICDRSLPEQGVLNQNFYHHNNCDLLDFDDSLFAALAADKEVILLMITAGIGRVADFQAHHIAEIEKMLTIDTVSTIKIFRVFFERILAEDSFYAGVMGSISGWLCSPAASVYAAAKAAVVRFVESVNIELEAAGTKNRILDVSPASFKGSKFYGGNNDLSVTEPLAEDIIKCLFDRETLFIPRYEEILKSVLERYHSNPHEYGLYSYQYKKDSGRLDNGKKANIGYLSGIFEPFNSDYISLFRHAKQRCDYLIVGVHDSYKQEGEGSFIPLEERKAIVSACRYVDKVVDGCQDDAKAWVLWHYDRLFVSPDCSSIEPCKHSEEFYKDKGVEIVTL